MENRLPENTDEITLAAFQRWVETARPKDKMVYHVGYLVSDREKAAQLPGYGLARIFIEPYHGIGEFAWWAYERGLVDLVQRKLAAGRYEYIAIKRRRKQR